MSRANPTRRWTDNRHLLTGGVILWYLVFFLVPFLLVVKISLSQMADTIPPYAPIFSWDGAQLAASITFGNFVRLFGDPIFVLAYLGSLKVAAVTTVLCALVGYPLAYAVAAAKPSARPSLLLLITIPFWTSFLVRIYAWIGILKDNGILNDTLLWLGVIDHPLRILNTSLSIYIGMLYCYLPFFLLPLYAVLERMDGTLMEAASDLGSRPFKTFWTVTLPLSMPGVFAGALLVFVPATGEYLIPKLLGGSVNLMIAPVLWDSFFIARDWPIASAATVTLVVLLLLPLAFVERVRARASDVAA
ncbi:ABC transporter permease subunit [Acidisoma cladoniae]|uniref:ABC transporter permease subunit n=1 Tax=Acidisoma cladoniae TaxID=3040935 RepID=UPI0025510A02|nr:ABC transporter permease subunit [Acidisoma sp. PAMC 29798]